MKTILAIVGDYYHDRDLAMESLENALFSYISVGEMQIVECETNQLVDKLAENPDAVILFKEDRLNPNDDQVHKWMTEEVEDEITSYVENGGGWLAWHSGLASYAIEGSYTKMVRGYFESHPDKHQIVTYTNKNENPISSSKLSFEALDEHYFVYCDVENTNVFLLSESVDGESTAGWSHAFGKGKVCALTPAHNKEGLLHPDFSEVLGNSVKWISSK